MNANKRILITPGEPAGIGPDIVIAAAQRPWPVELVVCADPALLQARARLLKLPLQLRYYQPDCCAEPQQPGSLTLLPVMTSVVPVAGTLNVGNSAYVLETLSRACDGCLSKEFSALVTGPVHKGIINDAGIPFSGHTEFFAERSHCPVVMMLMTEKLRVALATTHLPLRAVADAISQRHLREVITIIDKALKAQHGVSNPRIFVCGLNPHAGEGGHLGHEETEIIMPVLQALRAQGMNLTGPLPADTLFQAKYLQHADVVVAMYHDQGLPVLKYQGFGQAVNVTLGLPFIRTSVDHGTALELAATGKADAGSFMTALKLAIKMTAGSHE